MVLLYWICVGVLFCYIASDGFKLTPSEWESGLMAGAAWISFTAMFIIAILISIIFGIPLINITGFFG